MDTPNRPLNTTPNQTLDSTLDSLEWPRLVAFAKERARSLPAQDRVEGWLQPESWAQSVERAAELQEETREISGLLPLEALWAPLEELADPDASLERLGRGSVLETSELANLRRWLRALDAWRTLPQEELPGPLVTRFHSRLPDPSQPLQTLERILTPEGEISERASPRLQQLHQDIRSLKREIHSVLDQMVKTYSTQGVLQENFTDVRDGRYVIPVKISHQNDIDGIVYEASASRQTVFVEPREVAVLNNRLRQRQNDLIQEVFRVLEETSRELRPAAANLQAGTALLIYWDAAQARAKLSRVYDGKPVQITRERTFSLEGTANPLLWWAMAPEQVVKNHMVWGVSTGADAGANGGAHGSSASTGPSTLLLTGPNTGGKTVFLKTLGLAGLCARTGFQFPAESPATVPYFDQFFADVGDSQSIERHLSSFSGHVLRFRQILENLTSRSLVLLDELNSATDPEEGAALGRAFLETLMSRGALVVATTHDPQLKALSLSEPRILSVSMAFDEGSRMPTYRMLFGVPGRSRALETAARLGLPRDVLALAEKYLSREHQVLERTLQRLENELSQAEESRREADSLRDEARRLQQEWTARSQIKSAQILDQAQMKIRKILEQAQEEVRASLRRLDELKSRKEADEARASISGALREAGQAVTETLDAEAPGTIPKAPEPKPGSLEALQVGDWVKVPKWRSNGQILALSGKNVKVALGSISMSLTLSDLQPLDAADAKRLNQQSRRGSGGGGKSSSGGGAVSEAYAPESQIDLRGLRLEEALSQLQTYLDLSYRSGAMAEVVIVHGLGTGAIREATRKLLKKLPYVRDYRDGGQGRGGAGATVVEFER